jgi:hypothetical protein
VHKPALRPRAALMSGPCPRTGSASDEGSMTPPYNAGAGWLAPVARGPGTPLVWESRGRAGGEASDDCDDRVVHQIAAVECAHFIQR